LSGRWAAARSGSAGPAGIVTYGSTCAPFCTLVGTYGPDCPTVYRDMLDSESAVPLSITAQPGAVSTVLTPREFASPNRVQQGRGAQEMTQYVFDFTEGNKDQKELLG